MAEAYVHTGFWINYSKGHILGPTLTVPPRDGALLVSFLALYVRMVGTQLWSLLCFVLHQVRSTKKLRDGLHHQQQVLLRNSTSQNHTLLELVKLNWYWRRNANGGLWKTLPLASLAILHATTFALAGLFAYRATFSTADEVLIRSPFCGEFKFPTNSFQEWTEDTFDLGNAAMINQRTTSIWSSNYARNCYTNGFARGCNIFTRRRFDSTPDHDVRCPFTKEICMDDARGVIRLESDSIYSDLDLGINTPREDAIVYRKAMTCAPIIPDDFVSDAMPGADDALPGNKVYYYYFGDSVTNSKVTSNYTYEHDYYEAMTRSEPYKLNAERAMLHDSRTGFIPVNAINTTDSDLVLVFLENSARYTRRVTDMLFDAEREVKSTGSVGDHVYMQDWAVSVLACTEQHQFCNPSGNKEKSCSPMTGALELGRVFLDGLDFNARQYQVAVYIWNIISYYGLWDHISDLGSSALLAKNSLLGGDTMMSAPLADDQWIQEVTGWYRGVLATVQRMIVDFAQGPSDPMYNNETYIKRPSPETEWMCKSQKIRGTDFYNFSVAGLLLILLPGGLVLLANQIASVLVSFIQGITLKGLSRRREWRLTHNLQLQRMAYEGARIGSWEGQDDAVPVTAKGDVFGLPCDLAVASIYSRAESYSPLPQQQYYSPSIDDTGTEKEPKRLSVVNLS